MIPILQAISQVAVPVVSEPITIGGNGGGGMDFLTYSLILGVGCAVVLGFMAWSKVGALAMYRERAEERRQDKEIADLKEKVGDREHWLQHQIDGRTFPVQRAP